MFFQQFNINTWLDVWFSEMISITAATIGPGLLAELVMNEYGQIKGILADTLLLKPGSY